MTTMTTMTGSEVTTGYSFRFRTPDGTAIIIIDEREDGQPQHIFYNIGKAGTSVSAWAHALARMTSFALQSKSLQEVIDELADIASDRVIFSNGKSVRSGPEALCFALMQYKNIVEGR